MNFQEILVSIAWGPVLGALSAQFLFATFCLGFWLRNYKKINVWPAMEYLILSVEPILKVLAVSVGIFLGHWAISEVFNASDIYQHLFTQALIFVGLIAGSTYGAYATRNYTRLFT